MTTADVLLDLMNVFDRQANEYSSLNVDDIENEDLINDYQAGIAMGFNMARMLTLATLQELKRDELV